MDYPTEYNKTLELLTNKKKNIPDLFCKFAAAIKHQDDLPDVEEYLEGMNERIEDYDEQYSILVKELGVICREQQTKAEISILFFQTLLDFFRLAYSVYQDHPEKLQVFHQLLHTLRVFLETGNLSLQEEPLQKALLLHLSTLAWPLTSSQKTMESVAKQLGGSLKKQNKQKTRKQRKH